MSVWFAQNVMGAKMAQTSNTVLSVFRYFLSYNAMIASHLDNESILHVTIWGKWTLIILYQQQACKMWFRSTWTWMLEFNIRFVLKVLAPTRFCWIDFYVHGCVCIFIHSVSVVLQSVFIFRLHKILDEPRSRTKH